MKTTGAITFEPGFGDTVIGFVPKEPWEVLEVVSIPLANVYKRLRWIPQTQVRTVSWHCQSTHLGQFCDKLLLPVQPHELLL